MASFVALLAGIATPPVHAQSALDGFNPGANAAVETMLAQPDGKILVGGGFSALGGGGTGTAPRNFLGRLHPDGSVDAAFNPGADGPVSALALQPDGKILVGGAFSMLGGGGTGTTPRHYIGRLHPDGSLDTTFTLDSFIDSGANGGVGFIAVQPDGRILVGGGFTTLDGGRTSTIGVGRLNADGSLDKTFNLRGVTVAAIIGMALQLDGKLLVSGLIAPPNRPLLRRFHPDGSLDAAFNPDSNGNITAIAVQHDGKIVVAGIFTALGDPGAGTRPRSNIGRFNSDGTLDQDFNPGANSPVRTLAVQADGRLLVGGGFTTLGGGGAGATERNRIGRLHPDGSLDATFNPGADDYVYELVPQPDGRILVGGSFTTLGGGGTGSLARSRLGRLHPNGTVDADFNPGANGGAYALAVQADGKIVVGGTFTALGTLAAATPRSFIARLHRDGSLDAAFDPGANAPITALALQPDGKIVVAGSFTMLGGGGTGTTPRNYIGRLHPDGSLDTTFDPGANLRVGSLALQPDGKILVGGDFTTLGGGGSGTTQRNHIGRLHADGSLDLSFNPGANDNVSTMAVQPDGRILVGGGFTTLGGGGTGTTPRHHIGRLHADGSLDLDFNPGANSSIEALAVQPDGRIVVGGLFKFLGGGTGTTSRSFLGRFHSDGTLDASFDPGANDLVFSLALQTDGKILVGGWFTALGGGGIGTAVRHRIGRLHHDGALDQAFNPGASGSVVALALQPGGEVLIGGFFATLGGGGTGTTARLNLGRVTNTDPGVQFQRVSCPGCVRNASGTAQTQVFWSRTAAGPEAEHVTFEVSNDGVTYGAAIGGTRVPSGWQASLNGFTGSNWFVRARGYYQAGFTNSSGSMVESIQQVYLACPTITSASLPPATAGLPYSATLSASGAIGVISFGVSGALPAGLTLSSAGVISGTPTQSGTFQLTATATDQSSGCSGSQAVTLPISPTAPLLTLDRTALRFGAVTTGAVFTLQTAAQVVRLTQSGMGTVTWTATPNQPWLQVSPASGSGSADLTVSVIAIPGLPIGSPVTGAITVTATGAANAPGAVAVSLDLLLNGLSRPPFGVVDTPLDNTTGVTGALPFTGWALDDVEVTRVMVCRAAVAAEVAPVDPNCGGAQQIFVGFAVFVDGARPDVAGTYPSVPLNTRAGWGFMVLTNLLPNQGNGSFEFSIYAQDREGHTALIGIRTLTCANASATKPFGAIDTPSQGGVASTGSYAVFGWVLSRLARADPPGGGIVTVQVNGITVGSPDGWASRPDLTTVFPGYPGVDSALGVYSLNTLAYANGVHTIQWTVTDNLGVTEGIGSRFFTVSNGAGAVTAADAITTRRPPAAAESIGQAPLDGAAIIGRRGWDPSSAAQTFTSSASGRVVIRSEEVNRVELMLGASDGTHYTGYLRTSDGLAPLPIGSQLDATSGVFTWAPGVGFVGPYDLVFVRWMAAQPVSRQEVRIILAPKGSGAVGPQVVIDAPRSQQDVGQPFVLGGWAADLNASTGTGIATVHAWAYPLAGGPPVFLGATAYGGARPDVAAVHGDAFRDSGFGLVVQGLAHGHYDLAVFAWSTEIGDFVPAQVVRVTVR